MSIIDSLFFRRMSSAINFYRELGLGAVEVEDEISDNMLAPEFMTGELSVTETFSKDVFRLGRVLP